MRRNSLGYIQDAVREARDLYQLTPKGIRLDLTLYVYPDGHGNVIVRSGVNKSKPLPLNGAAEGSIALTALWADAASRARSARRRP